MRRTRDVDGREAASTRRLPGIGTRYAQLFAVFALAIAIVALFLSQALSSADEGFALQAGSLGRSTALIDDADARLFELQRQMHQFLLLPSKTGRAQIDASLDGLNDTITRLAGQSDWERDAALAAVVSVLPTDTDRLLRDVAELVHLVRTEAPVSVDKPRAGQAATLRNTAWTGDPDLAPTPGVQRNPRAGLQFLRDHIDPRLQTVRDGLTRLRSAAQAQRLAGAADISRLRKQLARTMYSVLGLVLLLGIVTYLVLNRLILRPVRALTANVYRDEPLPRLTPAVRESRGLLDAVGALKAQLADREREVQYLAQHDALTGLPNRDLFRQRLAESIDAARRHGMPVGVLFLDLDRFKQVNDSYGHAVGDEMLVEISRRLRTVFRQDDLVARLGGDEFAILLENLHQRDEMTRLAEKALSAIRRPYEVAGRLFHSGASMGIAVAPDDGTDPDRLIQLADTAMYAAKKDEGSSYRYVSAELTAEAAARHALENELREAIRRQQLELHFQPVLATSDGHLHCYESLLRWPHAEQGMLRPASFMNALADAGLCSAISDWALDQIQSKRPRGGAVISINLSARLLHDEAFAARLLERIDAGRLVPGELIIEITEDTLETDLRAAARVLHELKRRGVQIALDDFGTGQASLSHLRRFPFDYVKIDQSFVAGIGSVPNDEKLIQAIIRLAHALGMQVVAEGVETEKQRDFLITEGCDFIQGYLLGRPAVGG